MHVTLSRPHELSPAELESWRRLQASDMRLDSAFLSPEFAAAVGRCKDDVRVAVVREGGEIVAMLPFERERFGLGRALALGVSDAQAVICRPEFRVDALGLVRACGLGLWEYDHLVAHFEEFAPSSQVTVESRVMDLRGGFDAYLRQDNRRGRQTVHKLLQRRRNMERDLGRLSFVFDGSDRSALGTLMSWKSAQWKRTQRFDRFSRPWIRGVVEDLASATEPACRGILSTLSVAGRLAAVGLGLTTTTRLSGWLIAYEPSLGQYSPGLQFLLSLAESAAEHGIGLIDLGKGDEGYKESLASWSYPIGAGRVTARSSARMMLQARRGARVALVRVADAHPRLRSLAPSSLVGADRVH
ncbi:MAG: GNAT family N-acetyltransferase [Candidatus Dormibacteria bacterium]|jgi:CelD/BcsL family acetyltransferase involved in cellulose biosynthesis|nr:cellulose biosynthesis protein CelD [Chloroflexota bacterium]